MRSIFYAVNDHAGFMINSNSSSTSTDLLSGYSLIRGKDVDRTRLRNFIQQLNIKSRLELFRFLQSRVDTDNYLRWLSGAVLTGNFDGFHQNYTWYEKIKSGKYGILPWDYEGTWGGTVMEHELIPILFVFRGITDLPDDCWHFVVSVNNIKSCCGSI